MTKPKNWKMISRDTWNKVWQFNKFNITIAVSSDVNYASGWETVYWYLDLSISPSSFRLREEWHDLDDDNNGEHLTEDDRMERDKLIKIAKQFMSKSDMFTTKKQFHVLRKKFKK